MDYFMVNIPTSIKRKINDHLIFGYQAVMVVVQRYVDLNHFLREMFSQLHEPYEKVKVFLLALQQNITINLFDTPNQLNAIRFYRKILADVIRNKLEDEEQLRRANKRRSKRAISIEETIRPIRMLYVYSNIVDPRTYYYLRFENPEFVQLSKNYFDSITIQITNREHDLKFNSMNYEPVYLQLLFKKC